MAEIEIKYVRCLDPSCSCSSRDIPYLVPCKASSSAWPSLILELESRSTEILHTFALPADNEVGSDQRATVLARTGELCATSCRVGVGLDSGRGDLRTSVW